jgi:hypothetical protein
MRAPETGTRKAAATATAEPDDHAQKRFAPHHPGGQDVEIAGLSLCAASAFCRATTTGDCVQAAVVFPGFLRKARRFMVAVIFVSLQGRLSDSSKRALALASSYLAGGGFIMMQPDANALRSIHHARRPGVCLRASVHTRPGRR